MDARPRILTCTAQRGEPVVREIFHSHAELDMVYTLAQAMRELSTGGGARRFELILCTIHFDESRMFELLRFARSAAPELPCVCTRVVDTVLAGSFLKAMQIAVESMGAAWVDRHELHGKHGDADGDARFREAVLERCRHRMRR